MKSTSKYQILQGDVRSCLRKIQEKSVHCCVTSPPFWGLRDYGIEGQIGLEPVHDCLGWATGNPCGECYVCHMVEVFRGVRRVLRDDGVCFLNLGDSYNNNNGFSRCSKSWERDGRNHGSADKKANSNLKIKDLCMIPARVALALQADGWWLRSDIIWRKRAPMPESVTDRPTKSHEHIFLLTKSKSYFYDHVAVMEDAECSNELSVSYRKNGKSDSRKKKEEKPAFGDQGFWQPKTSRNLRDVWTLKPKNFTGSHFATFPYELPEKAIKAGTSEYGCCPECGKCWGRMVEKTETTGYDGLQDNSKILLRNDSLRHSGRIGEVNIKHTGWKPLCQCTTGDPIPCTVIDPFCGSGTSGVVALSLFRSFIGIELNQQYIDDFILPRLEKEAGRYKQTEFSQLAN